MSPRWDEIDRYVVISADAHAGADLRDYRPYLPAKYHDEFDAWADQYVSPFDDLIHATALRNWDSDFRIKELDADGIAGEVLFPNTIPPFFPTSTNIAIGLPKGRDFELRWEGIKAHNRWMDDFVALAPVRRRGLVQIFPHDVEIACDEVRWAHATGHFGGVLLPAVPPGHEVPPLYHTRYEPLWALCEELGMPLAHHVGTGNPEAPMDQPASHSVLISEMSIWPQRTFGHLILAGVFERYPNLRFVPTELSTGWALNSAAGLDMIVASMKQEAKNRTMPMFGGDVIDSLSLMPSGYLRRNVYFGASVYGPGEASTRAELGVEHIMWGNDYPHEEGSTPESRAALRWGFAEVPVEECRLMLAGNAAEVYGFDLEALVPVAMEIGPTVAEIHSAPERTVDDDYMGRPFAGGALLTRSRDAGSKF